MRQTDSCKEPANSEENVQPGDMQPAQIAHGAGLLVLQRAGILGARMNGLGEAAPEGAGRTFVYWLATACKQARIAGGLRQKDIPTDQQSQVSRFETAAHWPKDPEGLVQCYAQALRIKDSRALWEYALELWYEHGQPPKRVVRARVTDLPDDELLSRLRGDER